MENNTNFKSIIAILVAALSITAALLISLIFNLSIVGNLVLSWIITTIFAIFLFFTFDKRLSVKIVEKPVYIEKSVENPIQIPVENRTIEVVEKPVIIYRDIVRPEVQRFQARKPNIPKFKYLGSKATKKYHKKTCRLSKLIKKKFKIQSNSKNFFIRRHYEACKICFKKK